MSDYIFEVSDSLELSIWINAEEEYPVIFQPHWPDGTAWGSAAEAEAWAEAYIESITNPDCDYEPGSNPSEPTVAKTVETVLVSQETVVNEIEQSPAE